MPRDLSSLFYPKSVAIIGASSNPSKVGNIVLTNIQASGFQGKIIPVNKSGEKINSLDTYKTLAEIPETPDLVIVTIPAAGIIDVLKEIGEKGVKNVVVLAAGFKETGADGAKLEKELIEIALKYQINLLGPNCLGFVNNLCPINATFGEIIKESGNLRFITQSGALATSLFDWYKFIGLGIREFITLGNKAVLNENDFLHYFTGEIFNTVSSISDEGTPQVHPIGLYLESISNGPEFIKLAKEISKKDPIFILKPGKTVASVHAMQSHTGAIAGEDNVLDAALSEAGIVRCKTLEDFFDLSKVFAWAKIPEGPKVAVISNAGGPAVVSADFIIGAGLELAEIDPFTHAQLLKVLPQSAGVDNPIDVLGDALADRFAKASEIVLQSEKVNALVIILTPQIMTQVSQTAELLGDLKKKYNKPILCSFMGENLVAEGEKILNKNQVPFFRFPEEAINALSYMWKYKKHQIEADKMSMVPSPEIQIDKMKVKNIIESAVENSQKTLDNFGAHDLLASANIPVPACGLANNVEEAKQFAQKNGYPMVLKISAPNLLHKKAAGGIVIGIHNDEMLVTAWETLQRSVAQLPSEIKEHAKIQIQKEVEDGIEVIVGVKTDPTFGPVLLFGTGGSLTEIIGDHNISLLPLDIDKVKELVGRSKIYPILKGKGTESDYPLEKLYDLIIKLSRLSEAVPEISEIEINPVIVTKKDVWGVDGKVVLKQNDKSAKKPAFKNAKTLTAVNQASTFHYFDFETDVPFEFKPGQYISVKVSDERINCYSLAGKIDEKHFSLFVDVKPGGPGSKYFEKLKAGDDISFLGPLGNFTLNENDGAENLLFLGTGSGTSPLKCMIEDALASKKITKPIYLYIGVNYVEDIFWKDHLDQLCKTYPNFHYEIAVWKPNDTWKGHVGFITDLVNKDFPDASTCAAYLCGAVPMVESAVKLLLANKCPKERIYMEKF